MSQDNVAIVTGASSGIGAGIARRMLENGYRVVSLARRPPDFAHERLEAVEVDLLDAAATEAAAREVCARLPVIHVVHTAGEILANPIAQVTQVILLQAALPGMQARGFGRVWRMSSRAALGLPTRTAYSATKAGMVGMARTWALELAPSGITVNVVAPGPIQDTAMFQDVIEPGSERERALATAIPVRRLGRSEDVAHAVMFCAAREAGFVTGQVLYVCGGGSVGTIPI